MSKDAKYIKMIQSKRWKELRREKLTKEPLCEDCKESGMYVPAREVHHIVPVESALGITEMERLMFDCNNLRALCHDCHVLVHKAMKSHSRASVMEYAAKKTERFKDKFL